MQSLHVAISGLIGAGKTTLATKLSTILNLPVFYESVIDNRYLENFYRDMKTYAFEFQIYLLNNRFAQHQKLAWGNEGGIQDRSIYEDAIFAKMLNKQGLISDTAYEVYLTTFKHMSRFMDRPNLIIHLDITPEKSLERIKKRGRECENGITIEYLRDLYNGYEEFLGEISKSVRVIRVDWSEFIDEDKVGIEVMKEYESMRSIKTISF